MTRVAGVDEAGRGCAIGPLVVACVVFDDEGLERLGTLGVRDSKLLTPRRREALAEEIMGLAADHAYFDIPPRAIDRVVMRGVKLRRLNYLEAMAMARVIRDVEPDLVYVDPADVDALRYSEQIRRVLPFEPVIVCEHNADANYPAASAASILAKVRRDGIIAGLREEYGDFNSGYCHDGKTISFLEEWFRDGKECLPFIRASWQPVRRIMSRHGYP